MNSKTYTMIDPRQVAKKGYKGCKTASSVQNFCKTNQVDCCYWKPQGSSQKIMMIEWNSFRNAYKAAKNNTNANATANTTTSARARTTKKAKSNITSITTRSTGRTTNRTKSQARKSTSTWGTPQARKTNNARRTTTTRGAKVRRAA